MSIDFFKAECQEPSRTDAQFGLCDDEDGTKAYSNLDDPSKWVATVKNDNRKTVTFTAIDNCVIKIGEQEGRRRCDGMLTTAEHIYFVELKNQLKNWIPDAIEQLVSTIQFFTENHKINNYRHKKAFACNKRRGQFQVIDNEFNLTFYRKYGVRIDVQAEIIII